MNKSNLWQSIKETIGSMSLSIFLWSIGMSLGEYLNENAGHVVQFVCSKCGKRSDIIGDFIESELWLFCGHCRTKTTVVKLIQDGGAPNTAASR